MAAVKHTEYDPLFQEVAGVLQCPPEKWPTELLHYTKAASFQKIVETKSIVLFNPLSMNDRNEMLVGARILATSLQSDRCVIDGINSINATLDGFPRKFIEYIADRIDRDTLGSYVFCLSTPDPQHPTGMLSMWRAYAADGAGVSVGFNAAQIAKTYQQVRMPVVLYPVRYETEVELRAKIRAIVDKVVAVAGRAAPLWRTDEQAVLWGVYQAMIIAVATHKHPGFKEELEWRAISFWSFADEHAMLKQEVFEFGNRIRVGLRFDLEAYAKQVGLSLANLLTKVTIGPGEQQNIVADAVLHLLNGLGIENPRARIEVCRTPYRPNR
jgi:hypothetical protein